MKTILLLPLLFIMSMTVMSQDTITYHPSNVKVPLFDEGYLPYIVGSATIPGYGIEVRICSEEGAILPNGRRIAGLSCIISDEKSYVGGTLVYDGDTTTIISVGANTKGEGGAEFVVTGKDFTMRFDLSEGTILKLEESFTTFITEGKGIWTIHKKS